MPDIALAKPLNLTLDNGERVVLPAGFHRDQPPEVANHWYTRLHLVPDNSEATATAIAPAQADPSLVGDISGRLEAAEARIVTLVEEVGRVTGLWTDAHTRAEQLEVEKAQAVSAASAVGNGEAATAASPDELATARSERDAAIQRADAAEADLASLRAEMADLAAKVQSLTASLDEEKAAHSETMALAESATAPKAADASQADGTDADDANEFGGKAFGVKRRYQGKYAVVKQDDGSISFDSLSKADAEAKARELNAQG